MTLKFNLKVSQVLLRLRKVKEAWKLIEDVYSNLI
jgi:hypothetical protein